ncbi:ribosome recycling factor [Dehalococcoidia bacterium]|nr:ribosome recycling factor [Dehalococcoidia bacterium]
MSTIQEAIDQSEKKNTNSTEALKRELGSVRTGRANPAILDGIMVDYYGSSTPLNQIASISAPEARLLVVQPWDPQSIQSIEKAIQQLGTGMNPSVDGNVLRLPIPALTEERRKDMVKQVRQKIEEARISVRNNRRDSIEQIRSLEKNKDISQDESRRAQDQIQKITDLYINEIDLLGVEKEKEVMEV